MSSTPAAAVVRFSSLGDVLLAAHVPGFLREADPLRRVVFVTKERYEGILRGHPHVDRFFTLRDDSSDPAQAAPFGVRGGLGDLVAALKREGVGEVFDLHGNLRSALLTRRLEGARPSRVRKHALRRRLMVHARWLRPAPVPPLLRTYRALSGLTPDGPPDPWLRGALGTGELARAAATLSEEERREGSVILGVGARWETKRWPLRHFVALGAMVKRELKLPVRYALDPDDRALLGELTALLKAAERREVASLEFRPLAALAAHARAVVSNDSAVLHLGPALGIPAVGIFGSTVPEFGFARQGQRDEAVEIPLGCRPCDVHGKRRCPLGHHACLEQLEPSLVLAAIRRALKQVSSGSPVPAKGAA